MLDKDGLKGEISVSMTFASLMAAVSLFFTGVLIAQFDSFGPTIKVPLLFLIISTFSFIFASTIYNNAGTEVTLGKLRTVEKYMVYAKNIVEFLGLYPLILSIPLVIGAITGDNFLRVSTTAVAIMGLAFYSQSKFSVFEKQLRASRKRLYSAFIVALALALYAAQTSRYEHAVSLYIIIAVALLASLLVQTTYFSVRSKQYRVTFIRPFRDSDAPVLSEFIQKNLQKAKHHKQPDEIVAAIAAYASEDHIRKLAQERQVFVAVFGNKPAGLIDLDGNKVSFIFTDPDVQRKGIGRMLVDAAEVAATEQGHQHLEVLSSQANYKFYQKLGYSHADGNANGPGIMRKEI